MGAKLTGLHRTESDWLDRSLDKTPACRTGPDFLDRKRRPLNPQVPGSSPGGCTTRQAVEQTKHASAAVVLGRRVPKRVPKWVPNSIR